MSSLALYQVLIQHLPEPPNLSLIQQPNPMPEAWPVILDSIDFYRKRVQSFTVNDGKTSLVCTSAFPDVYDRLAALEVGSIIHLIGCETRFSEKHQRYILDVQDICTLKEYDDRIRAEQEEQERRLAWLKEETSWEQYS